MSYPSYGELKDSGIEWLGRIPKHWEGTRVKFTVSKVGSGKTPKGGAEVYLNEGITFLRSQNVYDDGLRLDDVVYISEDVDEEMADTRVQPKDVLLNITGASIGRTCIVPQNFTRANVNQHVCIIRPKIVAPEFLSYFLKSDAVKDQIRASENGSSREGLNFEQVSNLLLVYPEGNESEQQSIVAFLDRKTVELDELIRLKERQIELLGAKRQALISQAVTRGLDPSVKLRPSGIKWLGEIPAHWELPRLKFCLRSTEQGWSPSCENRTAEPDEWGVLKVGCVNGTSFNQSENKTLPSNLEPLTEYEIKDGDVLMSRANTRELLGSASVVENVRPRLLLCDKLYRLNLKSGILNNHFLVFSLGASVARHQIERDATGASDSMQNIGQDTVRNLLLPTPPIEEQFVIVDHIRLETLRIDMAVKTIRSQIDKLREYRQALISAAVTGKIDVGE